jgi:hypothetical protein
MKPTLDKLEAVHSKASRADAKGILNDVIVELCNEQKWKQCSKTLQPALAIHISVFNSPRADLLNSICCPQNK